MCVDGSVSCCSSEIFVLAVGNVEMCFGVPILFGEPKVDDVDLIAAFADAHKKVVRFDVAVDKGFSMDILDAGNLHSQLIVPRYKRIGEGRYKLVSEKKDSFQSELPVAKVE